MDYGSIIKRAWRITWRYKALWVLGIFAGVSGCQSGGGGGGGGGGGRGGGGGTPDFDMTQLSQTFERFLPALFALGLVFFVIGLVWFVLGIAARGGLVTGVNQIEDGGKPALGELWHSGFGRFWTLLGLQIVLGLPVLIAVLIMVLAILLPVFGPLVAGREPGPEILAPMVGGLCIGLPILILLSLVLGVLNLIALRYVMLGGQGVLQSISSAWRFFRIRFKDTFLMYLISGALNLAASIAIVIPIGIIAAAVAVPVLISGRMEDVGTVTVAVVVGVLAIFAISILYNGIWGTFTSALWTLFFRQVLQVQQAPVATQAPAWEPEMPAEQAPPTYPDVPRPPAPPVAGQPPEA